MVMILMTVSISGHPDPPALARDIARRNGFHSLGPLLKYAILTFFFLLKYALSYTTRMIHSLISIS